MPGTRTRPKPRIVIDETQPSSPRTSKAYFPSNPSSPPKTVRFPASTSGGPVSGISRPPTPTEAWSLYNFELHARACSACHNPHRAWRENRQLCDSGHGLALDVAIHVYSRDGVIYSTAHPNDNQSQPVHLEVPSTYQQVPLLLKANEHRLRSKEKKSAPIISYNQSHPIPARHGDEEKHPRRREETGYPETKITLEPGHPDRNRSHKIPATSSSSPPSSSSPSSKPKPSKYKTIVINDSQDGNIEDDGYTTAPPRRSPGNSGKRGSLYERDMQKRKPGGYRVEIREPARKGYEKGERRRDSGVWV
ncbi:hypothetical protein MBLNU230_g3666t1 [Neophaeotheca triangularis]